MAIVTRDGARRLPTLLWRLEECDLEPVRRFQPHVSISPRRHHRLVDHPRPQRLKTPPGLVRIRHPDGEPEWTSHHSASLDLIDKISLLAIEQLDGGASGRQDDDPAGRRVFSGRFRRRARKVWRFAS
jgi:hypothetical protein